MSSRGFKEMGIGWYRYELTPKDEWKGKRIVLDFQGIMLVGDVYLNGKRIGGTDYGYLGFDIDLSKLLKWGQSNEIAVKADTQNPANSRWFTGAGLYRDVNLIVTNKDLFFPRHPLFIRTQGNKEVKIKAEIINQQKVAKGQSAAKMPVGVRILDADGKVVARHQIETTGDANIVAVDNGNIASDELHIGKTQLEKTIQRNLFQGSALVILRAGDKPGKIELSVAGEKMKAKKLVLNTK